MGTAISSNKEVILELAATLKSYAMKFTKNATDAEDLLQETICRALDNQEKMMETANPKGWLFTIMRNTFVNDYRQNLKQNVVVDADAHYLNSASHAVYNLGESNLIIENINNAINQLADEFRIPFIMYYNGFKYHEIADYLNLPVGTIKSRVFAARRELKHFLETY